jgi:uncharacterized protein (DUF1499 family)
MKVVKSGLVFLVCLGLVSGAVAGQIGLENGRLRACPGSPNCVNSEEGRGVDPLPADGAQAWERLREVVAALGGRIESEGAGYLHATFRSRVFGFVDDVECRLDGDVIQIRSASRPGWGVLGANRRRGARIRTAVKEEAGK